MGDATEDLAQGVGEIAGGKIVAGEEIVQLFGEFFRGLGLGFFLGVLEAEMGVAGDAWGAAAAAIFV